MGILQNYNEGNMDGLRSINYSETGTQPPYVIKDIKDPPNNNDKTIGLQFNKRIDDTARIAQMLIDKPGLKFVGNQTLLSASELASKAKAAAAKKRNQEGGATNIGAALAGAAAAAGQVLKIVGSTLAQVPVNGTGTHFVRGFTPDTYIKSGDPNGLLGFLGFDGESGAARALQGKKIIPDGNPQEGLDSFPIEDTYAISTNPENNPEKLGLGDTSKNKYKNSAELKLSPFSGEYTFTYNDDYVNITGNPSILAQEGKTIGQENTGPGFTPLAKSALTPATSSFNDISENKFSEKNTSTGTSTKNNIINVKNEPYISSFSGKEITRIVGTDGSIPLRSNIEKDTIRKSPRPEQNTTGSYSGTTKTVNIGTTGSLQDFRNPNSENNFQGDRITNNYSLDYGSSKINRETRIGLGDQGKYVKITTNYTQDLGLSDRINAQDIITNPESEELDTAKREMRDLIKFRFEIITPEDNTFLFFRAFLTQFDDSYQGSWDTTKYLGRAENFYTYQGFERSMNIGFNIAAASRQEMKPLYRKMAALASVTAPTYGNDGKFMRGTIAKVTVGDYLYEVPGIIESVSYTWNTNYNWEIAFQNPEGSTDDDMQELPQIMDCSLTFKPIHSFIPEAVGKNRLLPYITNPTPPGTGKAKFISKDEFTANTI